MYLPLGWFASSARVVCIFRSGDLHLQRKTFPWCFSHYKSLHSYNIKAAICFFVPMKIPQEGAGNDDAVPRAAWLHVHHDVHMLERRYVHHRSTYIETLFYFLFILFLLFLLLQEHHNVCTCCGNKLKHREHMKTHRFRYCMHACIYVRICAYMCIRDRPNPTP